MAADNREQVIIIYSSSHLKGSLKVRFFYALKGRLHYQGILQKTNSKFLKRGALLVSSEHFETVAGFLRKWKCGFDAFVIKGGVNAKQA